MCTGPCGNCGIDCEFCSGCDNRGGGRIEGIYQDYIDGKEGNPGDQRGIPGSLCPGITVEI